MATAASDEQPGQLEPAVASASASGWRSWAAELARREQERLAGFGAIVVLGFLAGAAAVYAFAKIAREMLEQETTQIDSAAAAFVQQWRSPAMDVAARTISLFGSEVVVALGVVLLLVLGWQRRWGAATLLVLVTAGAQLLNDVLKSVYQRARPVPMVGLIAAQSWSFPSGHAMVSAAFYVFVAYLAWRLVSGWWRWLLATGLIVLVLLIGLSRIYLQAHYLSDVIAGYIAGFIWTDAVIVGSRLLNTRRTVPA